MRKQRRKTNAELIGSLADVTKQIYVNANFHSHKNTLSRGNLSYRNVSSVVDWNSVMCTAVNHIYKPITSSIIICFN